MRVLVVAGALALACFAPVGPAAANVLIHIDKSSQRMSVAVDGATRYVWPVSTGRAGYGTPSGSFRPQRLARTWFSKKYYNSPMPYSIFFHGGFAIHGSYEIRRLGGPASHGCVRLHPGNAATLFHLVQREGAGGTRIVVSGGNPAPRYRTPRYYVPEPQYAPVFPFFTN
jgi:lipoprotein-anchoring transpeptidase ErfK/SrfK